MSSYPRPIPTGYTSAPWGCCPDSIADVLHSWQVVEANAKSALEWGEYKGDASIIADAKARLARIEEDNERAQFERRYGI